MLSDLHLLLPELIIFVVMVVLLPVDLFLKNETLRLKTVYFLAQLALLFAAVTSYFFLGQEKVFAFDHAYVRDDIGSLVKIFMLLVTFLAFAYTQRDIAAKRLPSGEFHVLALGAVLGMMVLVSAGSLLALYLGLELLSLSLYTLVAMRKDNVESVEAGMKYFVMGAVASVVMLYGISIAYGFSGSLEIKKIWEAIGTGSHSGMLVMSLIFILVGAAFKLGVVPFHLWLPDVYQGAGTSVVAFVGSAPKIAAFGMLVRILLEIFPGLVLDWQKMLLVLSVLSIAIGNVLAVAQSNLKRMLAYSAIAQMGYFLLGFLTDKPDDFAAAFFYMVTYALVTVGALGAIAVFSKEGHEFENIEDFKGIGLLYPWYGFVLMLFMFSLAGVPPLVGFYAKFLVLKAVLVNDMVWLAIYGVFFAIIGAFYYLRVVKTLFFESPLSHNGSLIPTSSAVIASLDVKALLLVNALILLFAGVFPSLLLNLCRSVF